MTIIPNNQDVLIIFGSLNKDRNELQIRKLPVIAWNYKDGYFIPITLEKLPKLWMLEIRYNKCPIGWINEHGYWNTETWQQEWLKTLITNKKENI